MAQSDSKRFGLIILGNSGVGKSFLANVLLGREAFKHEFSARSVTHRTEYQEIVFDDHHYAIFNIPGLIEADQTRVDVNKREIDHAFTERPNSLIIYVFGQQNGRIRDEDVVAFNAINSAYPLKMESLLLVVNGLKPDRPTNYEGEVMLMLQDIVQIAVAPERVCFLDQIDPSDSLQRQGLKEQMLRAIVRLTPTVHTKVHDIRLRVDEVAALKKQIEEMTAAFELNKVHFQEEIHNHQERYDQFVASQQAEAEHFRRIIERQNEEASHTREEHAAQLAAFQQQLEEMRDEHARLATELQKKSDDEAESIQRALQESVQAQKVLQVKIEELKNRKPEVIIQKQPSSCFVGTTCVRMADGSDKPIEKVRAGDAVRGTGNRMHTVMFVDVEELAGRSLYGVNEFAPFFTAEHVFITADGMMASVDPQASEDEEPSLRGAVQRLSTDSELQGVVENRETPMSVERLTCSIADPTMKVYNVVLDSGHNYFANGFCVFDMFPNLGQYPRMFKFLHLLWRQCATEIDGHFDDIVTPGSADRQRLEGLAQVVQRAISDYLNKA